METKKPEPVQDQAQVVTGTAEQHVDLVALSAFQEVASQQPVGFQMTDDRLNGLAALERAFQSLRFDVALLSRYIHRACSCIMPPIALVHKRLINTRPGQAPDLCQGCLQSVAIIRVARHSHPTHHKVALVGVGMVNLTLELDARKFEIRSLLISLVELLRCQIVQR